MEWERKWKLRPSGLAQQLKRDAAMAESSATSVASPTKEEEEEEEEEITSPSPADSSPSVAPLAAAAETPPPATPSSGNRTTTTTTGRTASPPRTRPSLTKVLGAQNVDAEGKPPSGSIAMFAGQAAALAGKAVQGVGGRGQSSTTSYGGVGRGAKGPTVVGRGVSVIGGAAGVGGGGGVGGAGVGVGEAGRGGGRALVTVSPAAPVTSAAGGGGGKSLLPVASAGAGGGGGVKAAPTPVAAAGRGAGVGVGEAGRGGGRAVMVVGPAAPVPSAAGGGGGKSLLPVAYAGAGSGGGVKAVPTPVAAAGRGGGVGVGEAGRGGGRGVVAVSPAAHVPLAAGGGGGKSLLPVPPAAAGGGGGVKAVPTPVAAAGRGTGVGVGEAGRGGGRAVVAVSPAASVPSTAGGGGGKSLLPVASAGAGGGGGVKVVLTPVAAAGRGAGGLGTLTSGVSRAALVKGGLFPAAEEGGAGGGVGVGGGGYSKGGGSVSAIGPVSPAPGTKGLTARTSVMPVPKKGMATTTTITTTTTTTTMGGGGGIMAPSTAKGNLRTASGTWGTQGSMKGAEGRGGEAIREPVSLVKAAAAQFETGVGKQLKRTVGEFVSAASTKKTEANVEVPEADEEEEEYEGIAENPEDDSTAFFEWDLESLQKRTWVWLELMLRERFPADRSLGDLLADGEILVRLMKVLRPRLRLPDISNLLPRGAETTPALYKMGSRLGYYAVSNAATFLRFCREAGVSDVNLFTPPDLVEKKDTRRVCLTIRLLSVKARSARLAEYDLDNVMDEEVNFPSAKVEEILSTLTAQPPRRPEPALVDIYEGIEEEPEIGPNMLGRSESGASYISVSSQAEEPATPPSIGSKGSIPVTPASTGGRHIIPGCIRPSTVKGSPDPWSEIPPLFLDGNDSPQIAAKTAPSQSPTLKFAKLPPKSEPEQPFWKTPTRRVIPSTAPPPGKQGASIGHITQPRGPFGERESSKSREDSKSIPFDAKVGPGMKRRLDAKPEMSVRKIPDVDAPGVRRSFSEMKGGSSPDVKRGFTVKGDHLDASGIFEQEAVGVKRSFAEIKSGLSSDIGPPGVAERDAFQSPDLRAKVSTDLEGQKTASPGVSTKQLAAAFGEVHSASRVASPVSVPKKKRLSPVATPSDSPSSSAADGFGYLQDMKLKLKRTGFFNKPHPVDRRPVDTIGGSEPKDMDVETTVATEHKNVTEDTTVDTTIAIESKNMPLRDGPDSNVATPVQMEPLIGSMSSPDKLQSGPQPSDRGERGSSSVVDDESNRPTDSLGGDAPSSVAEVEPNTPTVMEGRMAGDVPAGLAPVHGAPDFQTDSVSEKDQAINKDDGKEVDPGVTAEQIVSGLVVASDEARWAESIPESVYGRQSNEVFTPVDDGQSVDNDEPMEQNEEFSLSFNEYLKGEDDDGEAVRNSEGSGAVDIREEVMSEANQQSALPLSPVYQPTDIREEVMSGANQQSALPLSPVYQPSVPQQDAVELPLVEGQSSEAEPADDANAATSHDDTAKEHVREAVAEDSAFAEEVTAPETAVEAPEAKDVAVVEGADMDVIDGTTLPEEAGGTQQEMAADMPLTTTRVSHEESVDSTVVEAVKSEELEQERQQGGEVHTEGEEGAVKTDESPKEKVDAETMIPKDMEPTERDHGEPSPVASLAPTTLASPSAVHLPVESVQSLESRTDGHHCQEKSRHEGEKDARKTGVPWSSIAAVAAAGLGIVLTILNRGRNGYQHSFAGSHVAEYRVQRGDTLSKISRELGYTRWQEIAHMNPTVRNPHVIFPNDVLKVSP